MHPQLCLKVDVGDFCQQFCRLGTETECAYSFIQTTSIVGKDMERLPKQDEPGLTALPL